MNTNFYKIRFTLDKRIRGRYERPHTVELESSFADYGWYRCKNIYEYFDCIDTFYSEMPKSIKGKLYRRKDFVDLMNNSPFLFSLEFVITAKVKSIFERLNICKDEYILKDIDIENFDDKFYLLFIPIQRIDALIDFKRSTFEYGDKEIMFIDSVDFYEQSSSKLFQPKKLFIPKEYMSKDIFSLQVGGLFFSDRVLNAFNEDNVTGYDIENGCFKVDLEFY